MSSPPERIRIYCVDDHPIVLNGLRADLEHVPSLQLVGSTTDARIALEEILALGSELDVVLSDIEMPHISGFDMCNALKQRGATPRVIFFTYHMSPEVQYKAERAKVDGILYKSAGAAEIVECVELVHRGLRIGAALPTSEDLPLKVATPLTDAELVVLRCIVCDHLSTNEIAEKLFRSRHTIEQHRKNIMEKLDVHNVMQLMAYGYSIGLCSDAKPGEER
jgi:DNA-binding NarL/FixJ family response regulator